MRLNDIQGMLQDGGHYLDEDTKVSWTRNDTTIRAQCYDWATTILTYNVYYGDITLEVRTVPSDGNYPFTHDRALLNRVLPDGLRIKSVKRGRWVVTGTDHIRQVPFHDGISFHNAAWKEDSPYADNEWVLRHALPYPDKSFIPKPIQHLVKRWAASYEPQTLTHPGCGMCVLDADTGRMNAATLDGGTHERQHLLDHILIGRLPGSFMNGILHEYRKHGVAPGCVGPFKQACYQVAVAYAYSTLRSTYA